jgi:hypothetical protein
VCTLKTWRTSSSLCVHTEVAIADAGVTTAVISFEVRGKVRCQYFSGTTCLPFSSASSLYMFLVNRLGSLAFSRGIFP